jgi:hypothetical protein
VNQESIHKFINNLGNYILSGNSKINLFQVQTSRMIIKDLFLKVISRLEQRCECERKVSSIIKYDFSVNKFRVCLFVLLSFSPPYLGLTILDKLIHHNPYKFIFLPLAINLDSFEKFFYYLKIFSKITTSIFI